MSLVKETGSLATSTANTLVDIDDWETYWEDRDTTMTDGTYTEEQITAALLSAADYLNGLVWKGRTHNYSQGMCWPRIEVTTRSGWLVAEDVVPEKVKAAQMELAKRELLSSGTLLPDLDRGGAVKRKKVDVLETEYFPGASPTKKFIQVRKLLADYVNFGVSRTVKRA